jgi:hypothetical protein
MRSPLLKCAEIVLLCATLIAAVAGQDAPSVPTSNTGTSARVFFDSNHRLQYTQDSSSNRIMEFSNAGYGGGGVSLPSALVQATVNPSGGDDTAAIQSAIDTVSALPLDSNGFRGTVQLAPGAFNVSTTLNIKASGVILHGAGSADGGTVINMTGNPFLFLRMGGTGSWQTVGSSASITDSYVPSGATSFNVNNAANFSLGDTVLVRRTISAAWIHFMGMDKLVRDGQPQTWLSPGNTITTDRTIAAIHGNQITLDVPLTDNFDSQFVTGSVVKYNFPGRISLVGVEGFKVVAIPKNVDITQPQFEGLSVNSLINAWLRDVIFQDTQNTLPVSGTVKQMTFDGVIVNHTAAHSGDGPADFAFSGTQIFANNCAVLGLGSNVWAAVTQGRVTGPVVLLNFHGDDRGFAPHQRWATGLLCDGCTFPNSHTSDKAGVAYSDRGILGSGKGWDAGWGVAWNVNAKTFTVQQPPGAQNFCIGCVGQILTQAEPGTSSPQLPNGIYDSHGTPVTPSSLYLEQLLERMGPQAVIDIGYLDYLKSIDSIPPVTSSSPSPSPNANGWNNSDVTLTLNATDNESSGGTGARQITYSASGAQSIASTVVPGKSASITINTEGATTISFFATDFAGNVETTNTVVVKVDKTPPTISGSPVPAANANGWNHTDVTVTFQCSDSVSGLAAGSPPTPTVLSGEGMNQSASGLCTDQAGNSASATVSGINIDQTPPTIGGSRTPAANANGWNNTDVTAAFQCSDALSGLAAGSPPAPTVLSTEGANQSVNGLCTDLAGNSASATVSGINIDKTPPMIAGSGTPAPNANGWNNTDVTVAFQCSDALSGLAAGSPPAPTALSTDGANQSAGGLCADLAGNSASATVSGINIDRTPPLVSCSANPNSLWPPNRKLVPVNTAVTVSDRLSGAAGFTLVSVTSNEPDSGLGDIQGYVVGRPSTSGFLRATRLGSGTGRVYTFTYSGNDLAGNSTSCSTSVVVPHDQGH